MQQFAHLYGTFLSLEGNRARLSFRDEGFEDACVFIPEVFLSSLSHAVNGDTVCLVQVNWDAVKRELLPQLVVLLPDYLLDVSAIAECMREYGAHPYYYFLNRLQEKANTAPILLGNAANFFLDAFLHAEVMDEVDFNEVLRQYFRSYAMELSTCSDLRKKENEAEFFGKLQLHFSHIRHIVADIFPKKEIHRERAVVEPSFMCPSLGLQGRLDFFEWNEEGTCTVIELKSGKTPFRDTGHTAIGLNHQTQASLYQIMVQQVLGIPYARLQTYICYSRCDEKENPLRLAHPSMQLIAQALEIRNQIVLLEYRMAAGALSAESLFAQLRPEKMIWNGELGNKLVKNYIIPQITHFMQPFSGMDPLEKVYFFAFYRFLTTEQYLSKCGSAECIDRSLSALWQLDEQAKLQEGMLLEGLRLAESHLADESTVVVLEMPETTCTVPDFRDGDTIILYAKENTHDNVAQHQVLKGAILSISANKLVLRLRNRQREQTLSPDRHYALEHDVLDNNFVTQFRGLYRFLRAPEERKALLLGKNVPRVTEGTACITIPCLPEIQTLIGKVSNARDLFLLVGPPGTGKTSIALRSLVAHFYGAGKTLLLMAYTNRAVDEICLAVETIVPDIPYVRLGSHVSCAPELQARLLSEQIQRCRNRREVRTSVAGCRVYIGTVASVAARPELLQDKAFDLGILDEASQVLEPQILGIWSATLPGGQPAIGKFVLIGDMKQLPAVVTQQTCDFTDEILLQQGIVSGKMSFFERMYRRYKGDPAIVGTLCKQGRMHPQVAAFSNRMFYGNMLQPVPLPHQQRTLSYGHSFTSPLQQKLAGSRLGYFEVEEPGEQAEASLVAQLAKEIWELYRQNKKPFDATTLGIIAPFRSQIARIRQCLQAFPIPGLHGVMVDTVERFQGSQRDVILFSFAVSSEKQLRQLTETTAVVDGLLVDRKMNVALTRAREQFFLVGRACWLDRDPLYRKLKQFLVTGATPINE